MTNEKQKESEEGIRLMLSPPTPTPSGILQQVLQQDDLFAATLYEQPKKDWKKACRKRLQCKPLQCLYSALPVTRWLPKYKWKRDILYDILSGITVAIMHIPQGMAYGLLGNVAPVVGIYMAFFPVIAYFIFGTSRHVSIGTFAIVCLMTGKAVSQHTTAEILKNGTLVRLPTASEDAILYTNIQVAMTMTFTISILLFVMYVFRLGIITNLMSETLVNGFTCACAFHVVASQMKDLFGLPVHKRRGAFALLYTVYDAVLAVPKANRTAVGVSLVVIVVSVINNEICKPRLAKKTRIPFPIELVAVVLGTAASYFGELHNKYDISIVGDIPTGMPELTPPVFSLIPDIIVEALILTIISYAITISMALIFANKLRYEVDANQELMALGFANLVGSFFCCMPVAASLSRSMIQQTVGGVSQLASIVSCTILFLILMWIGPIFESLPRCVLASIIVVALKSLLMQCKMLPVFWRMSKWDAGIWLVTFLTTVIISIDIGLGAGILMSLVSLFYQSQYPYTCLMGSVVNTDIYLDIERFKGAVELPGIKVFHYCGTLNFATKTLFKTLLYKTICFRALTTANKAKPGKKDITNEENENDPMLTKCVIIDCSALTYVDPAGVEQLRMISNDFKDAGIEFYIATCSGPVYESFKSCDKELKKDSRFQIFPRVHDAVMFARISFFTQSKEA